jgi:hypothetical protein
MTQDDQPVIFQNPGYITASKVNQQKIWSLRHFLPHHTEENATYRQSMKFKSK